MDALLVIRISALARLRTARECLQAALPAMERDDDEYHKLLVWLECHIEEMTRDVYLGQAA